MTYILFLCLFLQFPLPRPCLLFTDQNTNTDPARAEAEHANAGNTKRETTLKGTTSEMSAY